MSIYNAQYQGQWCSLKKSAIFGDIFIQLFLQILFNFTQFYSNLLTFTQCYSFFTFYPSVQKPGAHCS